MGEGKRRTEECLGIFKCKVWSEKSDHIASLSPNKIITGRHMT